MISEISPAALRATGLNRLTCTNRDSAAFQSWGLDALGNWAGYIESDGQTTTLDQTRTHDEVNQIGEIAATCGANWVDPAYDAAGNMMLAPRPGQESCACEALLLVYDGWNRLAKVYEDTDGDRGEIDEGDTLIAEYAYDGQGRRVTKTVEETTTHYFFNENWQVLETRVGGVEYPLDQYVWDIRYIDAPVVRFHDGNTDGDYDGGTQEGDNTLYYTQDANFNTTAVVDAATGEAAERYYYDSYGKPYICDPDTWSEIQWSGSLENTVLFGGYGFDPESGLMHTDYREYHSSLGRWTAQDKIPYLDGMNFYQYCVSSPISTRDPTGLNAVERPVEWEKGMRGSVIPVLGDIAGDIAKQIWGWLERAALRVFTEEENIDLSLFPPMSGRSFASQETCCLCFARAERQKESTTKRGESYMTKAADPTIRTAVDLDNAVKGRGGAGAGQKEGGWTSPFSVKIVKQEGPCGKLFMQNFAEHERSHWEDRNSLLASTGQGFGSTLLTMPNSLPLVGGGDKYWLAVSEAGASAAEARFLEEFLDECRMMGYGD